MEQVQTELSDGVLRIALNRPEKKNALTSAMYEALSEAVEQGEGDSAVRALLLHGNGDSFSAGNDLDDFLQKPWNGQAMPPAERFIRAVAGALKPVIAAVHGAAVGIGTTILLHCDLVYAAENTKFLMPFVNLGIVPEAASTLLLPATIGHQRAAALLMLGEPLNAQRAFELGMVNAVLLQDEVLTTALAAARKLVEKPAGALQACKQMLKTHSKAEIDRTIRAEVLTIAARLDAPETQEALRAFLEKRKPDFAKFR